MAELDGMYRAAINLAPNSIVHWFMMASFARAHLGTKLVSEATFAEMTSSLARQWKTMKHPDMKHFDATMIPMGLRTLPISRYPLMNRAMLTGLLRDEISPEVFAFLRQDPCGDTLPTPGSSAPEPQAAPPVRVRERTRTIPAPEPVVAPAPRIRERVRTGVPAVAAPPVRVRERTRSQ